ncbi:MAG TPA: sialidase family protein, partial [Thermoanaerobaculia bacterium]|nr:sialidase family protein [Thermoanaerobaculia bacterium]
MIGILWVLGGAAAGAAEQAPTAPPPSAAAAWRTLSIWGGDVRSMAVAPDDPDLVLAGTSTGQLYISRNGGASWADAGAPFSFAGWVVSSLRWDPNHAGRLWVALWGVWGGGQVAFSDDLGKSWAARSAGLSEEPVYSLALAPGRQGRIYAGTLSGVYGSEDDGASWRQLTGAEADIQKVTSLVVDPSRPDTVIAGTWRRAYRSDDGGHTWTGIFEGMVLDT